MNIEAVIIIEFAGRNTEVDIAAISFLDPAITAVTFNTTFFIED